MATYTPNYNLKKPAAADLVAVGDLNGNMDTLDTNLHRIEGRLTSVESNLTAVEGRLTSVESNVARMVTIDTEQTITMKKLFIKGMDGYSTKWHVVGKNSQTVGQYSMFAKLSGKHIGRFVNIEFMQSSNTATCHGILTIKFHPEDILATWSAMTSYGANNPLGAENIVIASDNTDIYLFWKRTATYGGLIARTAQMTDYGVTVDHDADITWYSPTDTDGKLLNNLDGYARVFIPDHTTPTPRNDAVSTAIVNKDWVQRNGATKPNNLIHDIGDETLDGYKTFKKEPTVNSMFAKLVLRDTRKHADGGLIQDVSLLFQDGNNLEFCRLRAGWRANGQAYLQTVLKNADGTDKYVMLAEGNL